MKFPDGLEWGAATAAYQIDGAAGQDGRGPSIWDTFSHTPGKVRDGDTGDVACDSYHRLDDDLALIEWLGLRAYRFSISWARVLPEGRGAVNRAGLDYYRRLLHGLAQRGVVPYVTLYHWDLPQALQDLGGWNNRDTADRFGEYVALVAAELGDLVPNWITLNEPWCAAFLGHHTGYHAPGLRSLPAAFDAAHQLLRAHGAAVAALRASGVSGRIGVTLNLSDVHAATGSEADRTAAARIDAHENRWFLDPILRGSYPADLADHTDLAFVHDGDLAAISAPLDFFGVNYYEQHRVVADPVGLFGARKLPVEPPLTDGGCGVRPEGLRRILARVASEYTSLPLYVTENGAAYRDEPDADGYVQDSARVAYFDAHVRALHDALADGVDLRGYFAWSLMDNFEWAEGYTRRFGITYVDFPTGARVPKASGHWYRALLAANAGTR